MIVANLKEIVTKAVIGKTKKSTKDKLEIVIDGDISNVLGCWVINHNFNGFNSNGKVSISGAYDINVWYSYDNNTKTNVIARNYTYSDLVNVKLKSSGTITNDNEIIVRSLTNPSVSNVSLDGNTIKLTVDKELGVEVVGDVKVRINVEDDFDDYDEEIDTSDIDNEINENYLNSVNPK